VQAVTRVVQLKEKIVLDPRNKNVRELIKRSSVRTLNDGTEVLMFRSEQGINKSGTQIMKRGKTSIPTYSKNSTALREYKELVKKIKEEPSTSTQAYTNEAFEGDDESETTVVDRGADLNDFNDKDNTFEDIELIDVRVTRDDIPGLTPTENRDLRGVLDPTDNMDLESRVGNDGALQKQIEYFQDTINKTMELRDETDDIEEFINLEERIVALREARDRTVMQKELEEGRQAQVEDISRFRKFVKWLEKEKVGLTGIAVSSAGLITALLIHARGAIVGTAKATSKVAKALANIAKKGAPILIPVLNAIATALSWGAKGIAWLASHLWVLVVAMSLLLYDYYMR
jgi:ABC-type proline/glycine betaine transport system ATPase subunit